MCSVYSKLTITTPERRHGGHFDDFSQIAVVSIVDFEQIINYSLGELEADGNLLATITLDFSISITYFYIYHLFYIHHFYWKNNRVFQTLAPYCH